MSVRQLEECILSMRDSCLEIRYDFLEILVVKKYFQFVLSA